MDAMVPKAFFSTIALMFSNPIVPDFGLQFLVALVIGLLMPERGVMPLHEALLKIPGIRQIEMKISESKRFERFLFQSKKGRRQTILPRLIAGYFVTYIIAIISAIIVYML